MTYVRPVPAVPDLEAATPVDLHDPHWRALRTELERRFPHGCGRKFRYKALGLLEAGLLGGLHLCRLYERGKRNARDLRLTRVDACVDRLPAAFEGYRILHISDTHFGNLDGLDEVLMARIAETEADAAVLTGDYVANPRGPIEAFESSMGKIVDAMKVRDGIFATLGNHDSLRLAEPFHRLGVDLLINRTTSISRGGESLHLTGIDDVYLFHTPKADEALGRAPRGFNVLLAHSPHMARKAASLGYALYLTGHTHGGQICLPGGRPVFTFTPGPRRRAAGLWRLGSMTGYTTTGAGVSMVPVRFNCRGEVALITLRRASS